MSKTDITALLALCAALASAVGNVVRQRSAQEVTDKPVGHLTLFGMLLRDGRWWLGGVGDIASYCLIAAALDRGSVVLVTALQVTALLFALPIYARFSHHRITPREWMWAVLLAGALALIVAVGHPAAGQQRASMHAWLIVAAVLGPVLGLCLLGARAWPDRPVAAVLLAAVAGSLLGLFAVLTKSVVDVIEHDAGHLVWTPELYAWVFVGVAGMIFHQSAYRAGALTASFPTVIAAKPLVGGVLGVTVLDERLHADRTGWLVLATGAVLVMVATVALARGEAATVGAGAGRDVRIADRPGAPSPGFSG